MAKKKVGSYFWQALLLTVVVFILGLYIGVRMEENRLEKINSYYIQSEVSLIDILALENLISTNTLDCGQLKIANMNLLDRVYLEAQLLDDYELRGKITDNLDDFHKKYDVLRGYLWVNSINIKDKCEDDFNTVVYFYNYEEEDLTKKAEQNVWSRVLMEVKEERGEEVVLIPIAADTELESLSSLLSHYGVETFPSVIVNEEIVLSELVEKDEILKLLN